MDNAADYRQEVIRRLKRLEEWNAPRVSNPFYTDSTTGHNMARWAARGFAAATYEAESTALLPNESASEYAARLQTRFERIKETFRNDDGDLDGGALGAMTTRSVRLVSMSSAPWRIGARNLITELTLAKTGPS